MHNKKDIEFTERTLKRMIRVHDSSIRNNPKNQYLLSRDYNDIITILNRIDGYKNYK